MRRISFRAGAAAAGPRQCAAAVRELERHSSVAIHEACTRGMNWIAGQQFAGLQPSSLPHHPWHSNLNHCSPALPVNIGHDQSERAKLTRRPRFHPQVHQDGVRALPADAELLASSRHCNVEVWSLGSSVLCIQGAHSCWHVKLTLCASLLPGRT